MAITITTKTTPKDVQYIHEKSLTIPEITPRPLKKLHQLSTKNLISTARENQKIIGWVIAEPLTKNSYELGLGFVEKSHRGQHLLYKMLKKLITNPQATYMYATYDSKIIQTMHDIFNFQQTTLTQIALSSHGKFITKRLKNPSATKTVAAHIAQNKPLYSIRKPLQ